ncbi:MAG: hypothetical protein ACKO3W_01360, partial [bacterium]
MTRTGWAEPAPDSSAAIAVTISWSRAGGLESNNSPIDIARASRARSRSEQHRDASEAGHAAMRFASRMRAR